jgi:hypothetical protein
MRDVGLLSVAMLAATLVACGGDDGDSNPDAASPGTPREVITESKELLVGEIAEAILTGGPDDRAVISVTAPAAKLDWNIHGHANDETTTIEEGFDVMSVHYTLEPPAQADWYLLLRNRDTAPMTVQIEIGLYGDMQWSGWQF